MGYSLSATHSHFVLTRANVAGRNGFGQSQRSLASHVFLPDTAWPGIPLLLERSIKDTLA